MSGASHKRPAGVWVTCVYVGLSSLATLFNVVLIVGWALSPTMMRSMVMGASILTKVAFVGSVALAIANVLGALFLFRFRKAAVQPFGWALALAASIAIIRLVETNYSDLSDSFSLLTVVEPLLITAIGTAIFLYARRLRARGVLS